MTVASTPCKLAIEQLKLQEGKISLDCVLTFNKKIEDGRSHFSQHGRKYYHLLVLTAKATIKNPGTELAQCFFLTLATLRWMNFNSLNSSAR